MTNDENILSNITLLFIEDDEVARLELSKFLKRRVGRLFVGEDGEKGLELIRKFNPDIIVTDLKMPNMTGLEMLKKAKEEGHRGGNIVITALSDSETIIDAIDSRIVKYMIKPIDTEELIKTIEEISIEVLKQKTGKTIIGKKYILDRGEKKELEDIIKSKVAFFIKKNTGKGPKNIRVFIQGEDINVEAEELITTFEQSILSDKKNSSLIEYNRKIFYETKKAEFEDLIYEGIEREVKLEEIKFSAKNNTDFLKFSFA